MAKRLNQEASSRTDRSAASSAAGKVLSKSSRAAKSAAGSALTQKPSKTSSTSKRVIKETSKTYHDALKRLVDR